MIGIGEPVIRTPPPNFDKLKESPVMDQGRGGGVFRQQRWSGPPPPHGQQGPRPGAPGGFQGNQHGGQGQRGGAFGFQGGYEGGAQGGQMQRGRPQIQDSRSFPQRQFPPHNPQQQQVGQNPQIQNQSPMANTAQGRHQEVSRTKVYLTLLIPMVNLSISLVDLVRTDQVPWVNSISPFRKWILQAEFLEETPL
uniref:Uncharacterized protein n=1 Tax=Arundo donax TaxID=35708 RepID=A0A0A8YYK6_ARUDO